MARLTQQQYDELKKRGLTDDRIKTLAKSKGYELPSSLGSKVIQGAIAATTPLNYKQSENALPFLKGVAKGAIKDIARPTAQLLQGTGQRLIAAATPMSLEEVRQKTGFKSLNDTTPEGQAVNQALQTQGGAELAGRVAANVASFFVPASPAVKTAGTATKIAGETATKLGIGLSSKEAPIVQAYLAKYTVPQRILAALKGETLSGEAVTNAGTALKNKLFGTESMIGVQAKRASDNIWKNVISPVLKNTKERVNMDSFVGEIQSQIDNVAELSRKNDLQTALNAFKEDYKGVGDVTYETLQKFKEGWTKFLPDKTFKGKPVGSAFREIQNIASGIARNKIYNLFPGAEGKAAYFDYGNLKNLQELGQKAMTGSKLKGGAGSFISGIYDKVVTPVATSGGLTLYKLGEGIEFVGKQGAKILGDLFK